MVLSIHLQGHDTVSTLNSAFTYKHQNFSLIHSNLCHRRLIIKSSQKLVLNTFQMHLEGRKIFKKLESAKTHKTHQTDQKVERLATLG